MLIGSRQFVLPECHWGRGCCGSALLHLSADVPIANQEHPPVDLGYTVQAVAALEHWHPPKVQADFFGAFLGFFYYVSLPVHG